MSIFNLDKVFKPRSIAVVGASDKPGNIGQLVFKNLRDGGYGLYDTFSASAGQYHYGPDGFRPNNDLKDDIYNVFLQWSPTHNTSLQAEYRGRKTEQGDLTLHFFPEDFLDNMRQKPEYDSFRLGFHQKFSVGSDLIANFMYKDQKLPTVLAFPDFFFVFEDTLKQKSLGGEVQYLHKSTGLNIIGGLAMWTQTVILLIIL